ncbi:hypothetical protein ACS0TY_025511 [Phlomoides rotata]
MPIDRFGELPDSLLIHILSFLNVKEAAITSVLSKRWESLWAELPRLEFRAEMARMDSPGDSGSIQKMRDFVCWVNRALAVRTVNYLENFDVSFLYHKCFSSDVDAWVQFAANNKVKKLNLHIYCWDDFYTPPEAMYSCPSLTTLHVKGCIMDFKRTVEWQSLTDLHLHVVFVDQRLLDEILTSCPVLYTLFLQRCRGFNRLEVNSGSRLHRLSIEDCEYKDDAPSLKISAPSIHSLKVVLPMWGRKLQLGNISSLVIADIDYEGFSWDSSAVDVMSGARELLESVNHVKELCVGLQFIKIVSMMAVTGWQLPQSMRKILIVASEYKYSIGIIDLLESSPNLESLVIVGCAIAGEDFILEPGVEDDLACDLLHLKTIRVRNFSGSTSEPMLTLARILLKRATTLEEMVITTDVKDLSDFTEMVQAMLTYPRSSAKAVVRLIK